MMLLFGAVILGLVFESVLLFVRPLWKQRALRYLFVGVAVLLHAFAAAGLLFFEFSALTGIFLLFTVYRVFNLLRIAEGRINELYLYKTARRTSFVLLAAQAGCGLIWLANDYFVPGNSFWLSLLLGVQFATASVMSVNTLRTLRHTKAENVEALGAHSDDLPTVTVAIPARNETDELEDCLYELVKSDYQKLEILVLDDCSQTK
ncbi:MAG TPA: glycosyltransferase family A protein, partial [Candidatus Saccharimonadales bacterium]|nr:glycosyltransferase family A protein [Candidatus Saccharimonadales bacterium]